jgi:hypothetical protein
MKQRLTTVYGNPEYDKTEWKNSLYKDIPEHWGMAISMGHLEYEVKWVTPTTVIIEKLYGDNFKIGYLVFYKDKKMWGKITKSNTKGL